MGMTFKLNKSASEISNRILGKKTALFAADELNKLMFDYVPMDTGSLARNVDVTATDSVGTVHYTSPYAVYQYYGEGFAFSKNKHPLATARWDKAMMQQKGAQFIRSVQAFVNKGG